MRHVIKYLGSKRVLVPVLGEIATAVGASTAVDLFTGTTRVAQELKRRGLEVTATDVASYSEVLSDCYVATDAEAVNGIELAEEIARLNELPGRPGYVTRTFCEASRYFQPHNGARIDAIRDAIESAHPVGSPLRHILLTSLLLAADRVDSTTGLQMAYLKSWSARSHRDLELVAPELIPGPGHTVCGDAMETVDRLPHVDLMYLDPPYNQHRYFTNYHVWETLVRWDEPEHYGIACKRADARDEITKSVFNVKREMPTAFADLVSRARADVLVVSYNDESWIGAEEMSEVLLAAGHETVLTLAFAGRRYVGARIGIHGPDGSRVGTVGRLTNVEHVFVAGPADRVERVVGVETVGAAAQ